MAEGAGVWAWRQRQAWPGRLAPGLWVGLRNLLCLACLAAAVLGRLPWAPAWLRWGWLPALILSLARGIARRQAAARRRQGLLADLPQAIDLLALATSAGLPLQQTLCAVAAVTPEGPLREELGGVAAAVVLGAAPEGALHALAERSGVPALGALAAAVARARWLGTPVEQVLWSQADALRQQLRHQLAARMGALPVKLTLVTVLCFLPALLVLAVLPSLLAVLTDLG